jgi:hypothetical protein
VRLFSFPEKNKEGIVQEWLQWIPDIFVFQSVIRGLWWKCSRKISCHCQTFYITRKIKSYDQLFKCRTLVILFLTYACVVAYLWQIEIISLWKRASSQLEKRSPWEVSHFMLPFSYWLWLTAFKRQTNAILNKIMDLFHNEIISFCQWKATIRLAPLKRVCIIYTCVQGTMLNPYDLQRVCITYTCDQVTMLNPCGLQQVCLIYHNTCKSV